MPRRLRVGPDENQLAYSSYSPSGWLSTAEDGGLTARGTSGTARRILVWDEGTESYVHEWVEGVQAWTGSGVLTTLASHDVSAWDMVIFGAEFGPIELEWPPLEVVLGVTDGNEEAELATRTVRGQSYVEGSSLVASLPVALDKEALNFFISVTPTDVVLGQWWVDEMRLKSKFYPGGGCVATFGSAVVYDTPTDVKYVSIVCRKCAEAVLRDTAPKIGRSPASPAIPFADWKR